MMGDYHKFLDEQGMSDSFVRKCSELEGDRIDIKSSNIVVKKSDIEGLGLFSVKQLSSGDFIMKAVLDGKRTEAGRYSNHSLTPNARAVRNGDDFDLYATSDIGDNEEITTNYRNTLSEVKKVDTSKSVAMARTDIAAFESALLELPQVDLPLNHHFSHGIYCREMMVAAGRAFTGAIHKTEHMSLLLHGEMLLNSTTGEAIRIHAPFMMISPPDTKKAGYAVTDCIFMTIHGTHERDLDKIEAEFVTDKYSGEG
jgi:hypothetical protein